MQIKYSSDKMTSTKISSKIIEMSVDTTLNINVPTSHNYDITQSQDGGIRVGVLQQTVYFGGKTEKWSYTNIDIMTETDMAEIKSIANERISMITAWKTYYFQDATTSEQIGTAIVAELKTNNRGEYDASGKPITEIAPIVIYFDIQGSYPSYGSIRCPIGTCKDNVVVRYDSLNFVINVIVLCAESFSYHSFDTRKLMSTDRLEFADANYFTRYVCRVLREDAFNPSGNLVLIYHGYDESDFCSVELINKKYGRLSKELAGYQFPTHRKMCGNTKITWTHTSITVKCYSCQLVFDLATGVTTIISESTQNVNIHFKNWMEDFDKPPQPYMIKGLSWRVPAGQAQPTRTFEFVDEIRDSYDPRFGKINKSIPTGYISLDWALLYENDNIAVFKIGSRTVIGFDKLLHYQPVIYHIPKTQDNREIIAVSRDHIYTYDFFDDEDEYGSYGGILTIRAYNFNFADRIDSLVRIAKFTEMQVGGAFTMVAKFLAHQKQ